MFKIISKRELLLYAAQISDMKAEIARLHTSLDHERKRAESAINALLIRSAKLALTPEPTGLTLDQEESIREKTYNIFGDGQEVSDEEALDKLQN